MMLHAAIALATAADLPLGEPTSDPPTSALPLPERRRVAVRGPPTRLSLGSRFRSQAQPAAHLEGRVQVYRTKITAIEATIGVSPQRELDLLGPPRALTSVDAGLELAWSPSPWLGVGPSAAFAYRVFGQQGQRIDDGWMPILGVHATALVLRARTWGLGLRGRGLIDLGRTELVLDTAAVERLSPFEAGLDLEVHFGHGRTRDDR